MKMTSVSQRLRRSAWAVIVAGVLAGCATPQPPAVKISLARDAVGRALAAQATQFAPLEMKTAQDKLARMDQAIEQRLAQDYLEANSRFHLLLYGACGNPVLLRSIESLWLQIGPFFNRLFTGADLSLRLNDFHEEAFAAIEAGDAKAARQAMEQDLIYFARFLLNLLELEQRPVPAR